MVGRMRDWYEIDNTHEVPSPTVLVYPDRIESNLRQMIKEAGDVSKLRPHVKTHKLPQIVRMKRELGINKFKTSTIAETEMVAVEGGEDVLLAYQPVGPNIGRLITLIQKFPQTHFSALVDCASVARSIANAATDAGVQVSLFVDLNVGMNRTGIAPGAEAQSLFELVAQTDSLRARGLHAYDGHLHDSDAEVLKTKMQAAFAPVWKLKESLEEAGHAVEKMVVSGTATSADMAKAYDVEVGAGTTVLWDQGQPGRCPEKRFLHAAVLLARVISHPTPDRICIDLGHKAVASEFQPPRVAFFGLESAKPVIHSEEHLVLQVDDPSVFPVGTPLYGIPYHVCPTMALHQSVWCAREGRASESWAVTARDRCLTI